MARQGKGSMPILVDYLSQSFKENPNIAAFQNCHFEHEYEQANGDKSKKALNSSVVIGEEDLGGKVYLPSLDLRNSRGRFGAN